MYIITYRSKKVFWFSKGIANGTMDKLPKKKLLCVGDAHKKGETWVPQGKFKSKDPRGHGR